MEFCQNVLLLEFNTINLFHQIEGIDVPVHFIQGRQDGVAPYQTAVEYYEYLHAATKTFTSFDNSAHLPHYDGPENFAKLLRDTIGNRN